MLKAHLSGSRRAAKMSVRSDADGWTHAHHADPDGRCCGWGGGHGSELIAVTGSYRCAPHSWPRRQAVRLGLGGAAVTMDGAAGLTGAAVPDGSPLTPSGGQDAHAAGRHRRAVRRLCGMRRPACTAHQQRTIQGHRHPQARVRLDPPARPPPSVVPPAVRHHVGSGSVVAFWLQFTRVRVMPGRHAPPGHGRFRTRPDCRHPSF